MKLYSNEQAIQAFKLYSMLSINGYGEKDELRSYLSDDLIRGLVDQFAQEVDCTIFSSGDYIYMIPISTNSVFHVSNDSLKKEYMPTKSTNLDLYLMYISIIVMFGEFYNSYQTTEATRDFLSMTQWLDSLDERIEAINEHGSERLKELDSEFDYNWSSIVEKWMDMDVIKENVKTQDARTISRKSFLNTVKKFLEANDLIKDIGNGEIEITEKVKTIVQRYYMEYDYNRGILDFMYNIDQKKGEK